MLGPGRDSLTTLQSPATTNIEADVSPELANIENASRRCRPTLRPAFRLFIPMSCKARPISASPLGARIPGSGENHCPMLSAVRMINRQHASLRRKQTDKQTQQTKTTPTTKQTQTKQKKTTTTTTSDTPPQRREDGKMGRWEDGKVERWGLSGNELGKLGKARFVKNVGR